MMMRGFECSCLKHKEMPVELPSSRLVAKSVNY